MRSPYEQIFQLSLGSVDRNVLSAKLEVPELWRYVQKEIFYRFLEQCKIQGEARTN
ncbi:MAG: hypothetical protein JO235_21260 [Chroococcidiopsidaceae cyanobacterium CP_BM_RX_35]|nr:hypothetical protein [Chroococcidiopsidaceae cyanobacterium CP_BM_RX_35]